MGGVTAWDITEIVEIAYRDTSHKIGQDEWKCDFAGEYFSIREALAVDDI